MTVLKKGQLWRHAKRGSVYRILATGMKMQCSSMPMIERYACDRQWVLYREANPLSGPGYFRLEEEFLDGRFELVEDV